MNILKKNKIDNLNNILIKEWHLTNVEEIENNTQIALIYDDIRIKFKDNIVSICAFYLNGNRCFVNKYYLDNDHYVIVKNENDDISGIVCLANNNELVLEQKEDNLHVKYYFKSE